VLDYDDLLLFFASLVEHPEAGPKVARTIRDTCWWTSIKIRTCCKLAFSRGSSPDGRGLTVVGDDAQSIYSFRAATVENILRLSAAV
jgi:DNA helicase-2/ATP-dependent DNA helicase PcrA